MLASCNSSQSVNRNINISLFIDFRVLCVLANHDSNALGQFFIADDIGFRYSMIIFCRAENRHDLSCVKAQPEYSKSKFPQWFSLTRNGDIRSMANPKSIARRNVARGVTGSAPGLQMITRNDEIQALTDACMTGGAKGTK